MSKSSTVYVGLDVHEDSIDLATANAAGDGKVRHVGGVGGDLAALDKALRRLISRGHRVPVVYEAGPCGFVTWRHPSAEIGCRKAAVGACRVTPVPSLPTIALTPAEPSGGAWCPCVTAS